MNIRRLLPLGAVACATALAALSLTACDDAGDRADGAGGRLDVVASFYPMQYLAQTIGGDHVHVTTLTKPGVEPHDLEISPRQVASLGDADLVVYLKGLQPAVDAAIDQAHPAHVAEAGAYTTFEDHGTEVDREHEGEPAHSGDAAADPHIWLDPVRYAQVARGVGTALRQADPRHAADYRARTTALTTRLTALDGDFRAGLRGRASDTFITTHAAFGYLAERYGLRQEAISGVDPENEPSPARIRDLHDLARREKVGTVFFETLASDRTARTLAHDLHLRTDVLDPLEGITDASRGDDYFEVQHANLTALRTALGAAGRKAAA